MKRLTILILEDEPPLAMDLCRQLQDLGHFPVAMPASAGDALRDLEHGPDVVVADLQIESQREVAAFLGERFGVAVVFLTAHVDEAMLEHATEAGSTRYVAKPVRSPELGSAVEIAFFRNEMERRLRERERWFASALSSVSDAVVTVDLRGNITFVNPAAELLIGLPSAEVVGRPSHDVLRLLDKERHSLESPLDRALHERFAIEHEDAGLVNLATGSIHAISDRSEAVVDHQRTLGAVMVFRDITEQKRLRQQLELADRLASLGTMAAGVAHEVNNPLTVVTTNAAFASECLGQLRDEAAAATESWPVAAMAGVEQSLQAISDIQSAGARIARIVTDLRSFARPAPALSSRASVPAAIDWATRTTSHELRHRARVVTRVGPVPDVIGDEARLGQIFVNLLLNAAHSIEPGRFDANEVTVTAFVDGEGRIVAEVKDTGAGMSAEVRQRIFEPFFTTKPVGLGTGLGLSISHGIVRSMGGELDVDSQVGRGTTMRIVLPAASVRTEAPAPAAVVTRTRSARLLAIDDEPLMLRAIVRMLRDHQVIVAERAEDALAILERDQEFDVIISDVMMPSMSGIELYERLVRRSRDLAARVVFITAGATTAGTADFLASIPNEWLEKPFAANTLQALVHRRVAAT